MLNHITSKLPGRVESNIAQYMKNYMEMKEGAFCMICEGYGHVANHCGTKKRIDAITKGTGMRQYWGAYKSAQKIDFMGDKADVAQDLRVEQHKVNHDNNVLTAATREKTYKEHLGKVQSDKMPIEQVRQ